MATVKCNGIAFVSPLYIPKGKTAKFSLEGFPPVAIPSWTATGAAPAAGKGREFSCAFNAPGNVTVTCAGVQMPISFSVQVFQIEGILTPEDNFSDRALDRFGVDERISLKIKTTPQGIAPASLGGVRWEIKGAGIAQNRSVYGLLQKGAADSAVPDESGEAYYVAPFTTGESNNPYFKLQESKDITLRMVIANGPFKGHGFEKTIKIFSPRAHMVAMIGSDLHANRFPSAGFIGLIHLHPTNVSFRTLEWSESIGFAVARGQRSGIGRGYFDYDHNKKHQTTRMTTGSGSSIDAYNRPGMEIGNGDSNTGCWVQQRDQVWTGYNPAYSPPSAVTVPTAPAAVAARQQPAVMRFANPAVAATQLSLGAGGQNEMVEPSEVQWPIDWQYRVRTDPTPATNRWIIFQVVIHKGEVDGRGTTRISKGTPNQPWPLAQVSKNLGDPNKWPAPAATTFPNVLGCKD